MTNLSSGQGREWSVAFRPEERCELFGDRVSTAAQKIAEHFGRTKHVSHIGNLLSSSEGELRKIDVELVQDDDGVEVVVRENIGSRWVTAWGPFEPSPS